MRCPIKEVSIPIIFLVMGNMDNHPISKGEDNKVESRGSKFAPKILSMLQKRWFKVAKSNADAPLESMLTPDQKRALATKIASPRVERV